MNFNVELLKLLASFGIVAFHGGDVPFRLFYYSGLVIFTILLIYYLPKTNSISIVKFSRSRFKRLMVPWAAWFLVYCFINLIIGNDFFDVNQPAYRWILVGRSVHLWFLPFAFISSALIVAVERYVSISEKTSLKLILISAVILVAFSFWTRIIDNINIPFQQWRHAFPAVFIGLALRHCKSKAHLVLLAFAISAASIVANSIGNNSFGIPYLVGVLSSIIFINLPQITPGKILEYSQCAYGIYLIHPVFYILFWTAGIPSSLFLATIIFTLSFIIIYRLRRFQALRPYM